MRNRLLTGIRLPIAIVAFVLVTALVAVAAIPALNARRGTSAADKTTPETAKEATTAPKPAAATTPVPAPAPVKKTQPAAKPAAPAKPSIDAYRGLGTWVDIFDGKVWDDPTAAVKAMKRRGIRTLYLETANSRSPAAIYRPEATEEFIRAAHANDMDVVAWYLADMENVGRDYGRSMAAIRFRTSDGQKFDSFALDIESPAVKSQSKRNRNLEALSTRIRKAAGPSYPLGACIPSPVGLAKKGSYWSRFPYAMLAETYDIFVPMSYYTYHGEGGSLAYNDTRDNIRILLAQKGAAGTPIHMIGGLADKSSVAEVRGFAKAAGQSGSVVGTSLYGWPESNGAHWKAMK